MTNSNASPLSPAWPRLAALAAVVCLPHATVSAQETIYSQDFETDTTADWAVNQTGAGFNYADFFYDYSLVGLPSAPHSSGGSTRGLKLGANLGNRSPANGGTAVFPAGISVSPMSFGISENFEMRFDMWLNYHQGGAATNIVGGQGSTMVGGAGYGTAGTSAQVAGVADSVFIGASVDGGSGADYRVYGPLVSVSYNDTNTVIRTDPTSLPVYAAGATPGSRNENHPYYATNFPARSIPAAQVALFPRQANGKGIAGSVGFQWRDVTLRKVGTVFTYYIDGILIGRVDTTDAGAPAGDKILFNFYDINADGCVDVDGTNLLFAVFDNVRITSFTNVVNISAGQPASSETGPTPGVVTFTRSSADGPLTVAYEVTGSATSGADFVALPGTVAFGPSDLSVDVSITPVDDSVSEVAERVIVSIVPGAGYVGAGSAVVNIADNDTPVVNVTAVQPTMYERLASDFVRFRVTRFGNMDAADFPVNLAFSGVASGAIVAPATVTLAAGAASADFLVMPVDNSLETGTRTVTVTLTAGSGYTVGTNSPSASASIVDDETTQSSVLYSSALSSAGDASNWSVVYGTGDPLTNGANFSAEFGYELTGVPSLPPGGSSKVLRLTSNKALAPIGASGGVNAYLTNQSFSGDYAVRFQVNLIEDSNLSTATEGMLFGINHSGTRSNWWHGGGGFVEPGATWGSDGIWFFVCSQPGGTSAGDYQIFTGLGGTNGNTGWQRISAKLATAYTNVFKANPDTATYPGPYTSYGSTAPTAGVPANVDPAIVPGDNWADVEIRQVRNVVTLSINKSEIFSYTNRTVWTNGYLMLGYSDPFASATAGSIGAAYYANLKVVRLDAANITATTLGEGTVTLDFTTTDTVTPFVVEGAATVDGTFARLNATITYQGNGSYRVVAPRTGDMQFFRLRRQ